MKRQLFDGSYGEMIEVLRGFSLLGKVQSNVFQGAEFPERMIKNL